VEDVKKLQHPPQKVEDVVRRGRLRWFGHVERMDKEKNWVSKCRDLKVEGQRDRGEGGRVGWSVLKRIWQI